MSDFGPKITIKIVERLREDILAGKLKSGNEIKVLMLSFCIQDINLLLPELNFMFIVANPCSLLLLLLKIKSSVQ